MHSEVIGISHLLPYGLFGGQVVFLYRLVAEEGVKAFFFAVLS